MPSERKLKPGWRWMLCSPDGKLHEVDAAPEAFGDSPLRDGDRVVVASAILPDGASIPDAPEWLGKHGRISRLLEYDDNPWAFVKFDDGRPANIFLCNLRRERADEAPKPEPSKRAMAVSLMMKDMGISRKTAVVCLDAVIEAAKGADDDS